MVRGPAVLVEGLSKEYLLGGARPPGESFRELVARVAAAPFRRPSGRPAEGGGSRFLALKGVSLELAPGEVLGVIGRNGAGKTTLLKVLARITPPTGGRVVLRGRVASLLEVGTGFHPELTGRENIFLNGAILGMSRREIESKFDAIVSFAEVAPFLDTPVKRYSSGMYVRLAFAVAAHLEPDILLVDEVLAVGDAEFQRKCLGRMRKAREGGRTVVFVSHNMGAVGQLCDRVVLLRGGEVDFCGTTEEGVRRYMEQTAPSGTGLGSHLFTGPLGERIVFRAIAVNDQPLPGPIVVSPRSPIVISVEGDSRDDLRACELLVGLERSGLRVGTLRDTRQPEPLGAGPFRFEVAIPAMMLRPGRYAVSAGAQSPSLREWMWGADLGEFTVLEEWGDDYRPGMDGVVHFPFQGKRLQGALAGAEK